MSALSDQRPVEFFIRELQESLEKERLRVSGDASIYLALLLADIQATQTIALTTDSLAPVYLRARATGALAQRRQLLRRVGDTALLACGWWWRYVDLMRHGRPGEEYYMGLGRHAYHLIGGMLYTELSHKFSELVDALARISAKFQESGGPSESRDRHLLVWMRSQSRHAERFLREAGIHFTEHDRLVMSRKAHPREVN